MDELSQGPTVVKHVMTPEMKADGLSKGYDPRDHKQFADKISYKK
jgi:hypothetical protein